MALMRHIVMIYPGKGLEHRVKEMIGQRPELVPLRDRTGHVDEDNGDWGCC